jgi:hypothetical protein
VFIPSRDMASLFALLMVMASLFIALRDMASLFALLMVMVSLFMALLNPRTWPRGSQVNGRDLVSDCSTNLPDSKNRSQLLCKLFI